MSGGTGDSTLVFGADDRALIAAIQRQKIAMQQQADKLDAIARKSWEHAERKRKQDEEEAKRRQNLGQVIAANLRAEISGFGAKAVGLIAIKKAVEEVINQYARWDAAQRDLAQQGEVTRKTLMETLAAAGRVGEVGEIAKLADSLGVKGEIGQQAISGALSADSGMGRQQLTEIAREAAKAALVGGDARALAASGAQLSKVLGLSGQEGVEAAFLARQGLGADADALTSDANLRAMRRLTSGGVSPAAALAMSATAIDLNLPPEAVDGLARSIAEAARRTGKTGDEALFAALQDERTLKALGMGDKQLANLDMLAKQAGKVQALSENLERALAPGGANAIGDAVNAAARTPEGALQVKSVSAATNQRLVERAAQFREMVTAASGKGAGRRWDQYIEGVGVDYVESPLQWMFDSRIASRDPNQRARAMVDMQMNRTRGLSSAEAEPLRKIGEEIIKAIEENAKALKENNHRLGGGPSGADVDRHVAN